MRKFTQMAEKSPRLRVLIVDDEPLIRWCLAETLSDCGHSILEAGDGDAAVRALADGAEPVDVILLDYHLPDSNDLNMLSTVRRMAPNAVVIVMTAFGTPEVVKGALDLGAYRVLPKPFEVHEIAELVLQAYALGRR